MRRIPEPADESPIALSLSGLDPERWRRISAVVDEALDLPADQVAAFLTEACAGDSDLRAQVEELLAADRSVDERFLGASTIEPDALDAWVPNGARLVDTTTALLSHTVSSPRSDDGRFVPGSLIAGRYRVVALVGRGGMGEVYRADDLRLGHPVALKFLPREFERDPDRVQRLLGEVRTARQIAHPNVCRLYDVVEAGTEVFVTMEFVDGEDLSSLLGRIGRLPAVRAADVARQFTSGLAAAHDLGFVHRDLKPSNVMMDGRGRIRIADFGLAAAAGHVEPDEVQADTRAYMAPEQRAGLDVSQRSDVYALGLVLYELFTGRHPFESSRWGDAPPGLPANPTELVEDFDPAVARVIVHCLEPDPSDRPASAIDVLRELPGGDLLASAMAVGETPSPELVAAVGPRGAIAPRTAALLVAGLAVGLAAVLLLADSTVVLNRVVAPKPMAALAADARAIAQRLGHDVTGFDSYTWGTNWLNTIDWYPSDRTGPHRWDVLAHPDAHVYSAVTRFSPWPIVPLQLAGIPSMWDPVPGPGDLIIVTDTRGRLRGLQAFPPPTAEQHDGGPPDWSLLFELAGLDAAAFEPVESTRTSKVPADARAAWTGTWPDGSGPVRIEAAALHGQLASLDLEFRFQTVWPLNLESSPSREWIYFVFLVFFAVIGGWLLWRNLRTGYGDRRGARSLALVVLLLNLAWWVVGAHHVPSLWDEVISGARAGEESIFAAAVMWACYIVFEPIVRRVRPDALVAWTRLLRGGWTDPLVGRNLLIGLAFGPLIVLTGSQLHVVLPRLWGSATAPPPLLTPVGHFFGPRIPDLLDAPSAIAGVFALLLNTMYAVLTLSVLFFALQRLLRSRAAAYAVAVPVNAVMAWTVAMSGYSAIGWACGLVWSALFFGVLDRFGPLASFGATVVLMTYHHYPFTLDASRTYFPFGLAGIAGIVAVALLAAAIACGRPPRIAR